MAKESIAIEKPDESFIIKELREIIDQQKQLIETLSRQMDILTKAVKAEPEKTAPPLTKVTQINVGKKKYFCLTPQEQEIFRSNHPNMKIETFEVEMPEYMATKYLENPENVKAFERKTA